MDSDTNKVGQIRSPSAALAVTAIFSAMAVAITLTRLTIPFPPLPYLKFDFSEVPVTVAMLLMGPLYGFISSVIYWLVLTMRAGEVLGPAMKFAAVASMIQGFWLSSFVYKRVLKRKGVTSMMIVGFVFGSFARVVVMSVFNYLVLLYIAPYYVDFIGPILASIGLPAESTLDIVFWSLLLTAFYNIIHTAISVFPAYLLTKASLERIPSIIGGAWIQAYFEK